MLDNILSFGVVETIGWVLLHFIWQGAAIAVLLAAALRLLRKASANMRYLAACSAMVLFVLSAVVTMHLVKPTQPDLPMRIDSAESAGRPIALTPAVEKTPESTSTINPKLTETATVPPGISWKARATASLERLLPHIVLVWILGVLLLSVWHLGGWAQLRRLRRRMVKPVGSAVQAGARRLAELIGVRRAVELMESALVQVPTVVGWVRPVILLPASVLTGLSSEQLEAVLAHELAHIKRYDYLVNMFQAVIEILGFYHPAVWWVSHRIRIERENCCDDVAVRIVGDKVRYARTLTMLEEIRGSSRRLAVAASGGSLLERVRRLVGKGSQGQERSGWVSAVVVLVVLSAVLPAAVAVRSRIQSGAGDNTAQKEALEKAGARVTSDTDGQITQIYFGSKATDDGLSLLEALKKLKRLYLETGKISDDGLVYLEKLTSLEYLSLYQTPITDAGLVHVGKLVNLQELILRGTGVTEAGLVYLKALTKLQSLDPGWNQISDAGLRQLSEMKSLKNLDLLHTDLSTKGLEYLTALPKLENLILGSPKIDDAAAEIIGRMKQLRMLELRFTEVTDAGMKHIGKLSNLEQLDLSSRHVTNAGLAHVAGLNQLRMVELRGPHFGDESLKYFLKLPMLERLDLTYVWGSSRGGYTANGLALLKDIKTLRVLWLNGWYIAEAELEQLCAMKNLKELTLSTDNLDVVGSDLREKALAVRERLRQALPDTQINLGPFNFKLPDTNKKLAADTTWGEPVEGVGCRLRAQKPVWQSGETPSRLEVDVRNLGNRVIVLYPNYQYNAAELQVDGQWYYIPEEFGRAHAESFFFEPGRQHSGHIPDLGESFWRSKTDGKPLTLLPGRHTICVAFTVYAKDRTEPIRFVSNAVEIEILGDKVGETGWGEAVEGISARLRVTGTPIAPGQPPTLKIDLRSEQARTLPSGIAQVPDEFEVCVDGQWYHFKGTDIRSYIDPAAVKDREGIHLLLFRGWQRKSDGTPMNLAAGRHTVQAAFIVKSDTGGSQSTLRVLSNPVEIETLAPTAARGAWGEPVEGVQARLGAQKVTWKAGEFPKLKLDMCNLGSRELFTWPNQQMCELQVDGVWYRWNLGGPDYPWSEFGPGAKHHDIEVSLPGGWFTRQWAQLKLDKGRHVVRVAFESVPPINSGGDRVRAISNPVEIEILGPKESAAEVSGGGGPKFAASLANGATVELIGVCEHPSDGKQWWRPDGEVLGSPPYKRLHDREAYNKLRLFEVVYRLRPHKGAQSTIDKTEIIPGRFGPYPIERETEGVSESAKNSFYAFIPIKKDGVEKVDLPISVGTKNCWKKLASIAAPVNRTGMNTDKVDLHARAGEGNRTVAFVTHRIFDETIRIIATDKAGKIRRAVSTRGKTMNWAGSLIAEFDVSVNEIASIEVQSQKFEKVTFKNVSLKPNFKTDVEVEVEKPAVGGKNASSEVVEAVQVAQDGPGEICVLGRVLDRVGGKGVGGAKVKLWSDWTRQSRFAVTDKDGVYRFDNVEPGPHILRIADLPGGVWTEGVAILAASDAGRSGKTNLYRDSGLGYRIAEVGTRGKPRGSYAFEALIVSPGHKQMVELYLELPQSVSGTVRDKATGEPVAGAGVNFMSLDVLRPTIHTDDKGQYRLFVPPGEIQVICEGTEERYYPGGKLGERNKTVRLNKGEHVKDLDFQVHSSPTFDGEVIMADGSKAPEGMDVNMVFAWRQKNRMTGGGIFYDGRTTRQLKTDKDGRFKEYVRSPHGEQAFGHQDVSITAYMLTDDFSHGGMVWTGIIELSDPKIDPIRIVMTQTGSAEFRVIDPDEQGVEGASIRGINIFWVIHGKPWRPIQCDARVTDLGQGRYRIDGLIEGFGYIPHVEAAGYRHDYSYSTHGNPIVVQAGQHIRCGDIKLEWNDARAVPGLIEMIGPNSLNIISRLGQIGTDASDAVPGLVNLLKKSTNTTTICATVRTLGKIGVASEVVVEALINVVETKRGSPVNVAAEALADLGVTEAIEPIITALEEGRIGHRFAEPVLWRLRKAAGTGSNAEPVTGDGWGEAVGKGGYGNGLGGYGALGSAPWPGEKTGMQVRPVRIDGPAQIRIEASFLLVPIDANELNDFFEREKIAFVSGQDDPNYTNVLNDKQVRELLKLAAGLKETRVLTAPAVIVLDGQNATISVATESIVYAAGFIEPSEPSGTPQPLKDSVKTGTTLTVTPVLEDRNINLDVDYEVSKIARYQRQMYKGKYPYKVPVVQKTGAHTRVLVGDGQTILLGGQKVSRREDKDTPIVEANLLVLIKAEKIEPSKESKEALG